MHIRPIYISGIVFIVFYVLNCMPVCVCGGIYFYLLALNCMVHIYENINL